jgi:RHS repeat-associated protein
MLKRALRVVVAVGLFGVALGAVETWWLAPTPETIGDRDQAQRPGPGLPGLELVTPAFAAGNQPPTANAGLDRTVAVGEAVVLDGSASTEPEGAKVDFLWAVVSAPVGSAAALDDVTAVRPSFVADLAGDFVIELVVSEGPRDSTPATVTISTINSAPVADAGRDRAIAPGQSVRLDGGGSSDFDGDALTYGWTLVSRPAGSAAVLDDPAAVQPSILADLAGDYVAELIVNDGILSSAADSVSYAAYRYDGLGRRIEKDVDGTVTQFLYDGSDILLEHDGAASLLARYSHGQGVDQPLAVERDVNANGTFEAGELFYYQADHQGSVRALTDSAGLAANSYDYDAYGNIEASVEAISNPYTYTGRELDAEAGLYYYRARYYDPATGRFVNQDPIGFGAGDANLYRYVRNNPANLIDPRGLFLVLFGGSASGGDGVAGIVEGGIAVDIITEENARFFTAGLGAGGGLSAEVFYSGFFTGGIDEFAGIGGQFSITIGAVTFSAFSSKGSLDFGFSLGVGPGFSIFGGLTYTDIIERSGRERATSAACAAYGPN